MAYVVGCLMAAFSFLVNKWLISNIGNKVIISYSPVLEEIAKSLLAYYLGADILITHVVFGIIEAGYDFYNGSKKIALKAALFSVGGHSIFGIITISILYITSSIWLSLAGAILAHLIYNVMVVLECSK